MNKRARLYAILMAFTLALGGLAGISSTTASAGTVTVGCSTELRQYSAINYDCPFTIRHMERGTFQYVYEGTKAARGYTSTNTVLPSIYEWWIVAVA